MEQAGRSNTNAWGTFRWDKPFELRNYKILTKLSPPSFCDHAGDISTLGGDNIHAEVNQGTNKKKKKIYISGGTIQGTLLIYVRVIRTRKRPK